MLIACDRVCTLQMALTAASPVFKGRLVDTDTRWDVIAGSVDCRTPAERGISDEVGPGRCLQRRFIRTLLPT